MEHNMGHNMTNNTAQHRANHRVQLRAQHIMSRIERKYCLISTSCLTELSDFFILLHI